MHPITQSLQSIYNTHATHFSQTRKKHRPEIEHIIDYINTLPQKTLHILELGCGDWRLYAYLSKQTKKTIKYTGVDIADKLLAIGKKAYPDAKFIHTDMIDFIQKGKQESIDIIICLASFHHLPWEKQRLFLLKSSYRLLKYDGQLIMTNRALSQWFMKKYRKPLSTSLIKYIFSLGQKSRRDVYIPRSRQWERYYHMFHPAQIARLWKQAGFMIKTNSSINQQGKTTTQSSTARMTLTICQKSIQNYS